MSRKKRDLSEEEASLWRRVASTVKPRRRGAVIAPPEKAAEVAPTKSPKPKHETRSPPRPAPRAERIAPPPADRGGEKKIRRGKLEIDASLDLHGHTQDSARAALARFVHAAQARGDRTVIVITGAGRLGKPAVLKQRLPDWLAELRPAIAGYAQAHRTHGGGGAFYVFLKRKR